jgi:hypothetical protein
LTSEQQKELNNYIQTNRKKQNTDKILNKTLTVDKQSNPSLCITKKHVKDAKQSLMYTSAIENLTNLVF